MDNQDFSPVQLLRELVMDLLSAEHDLEKEEEIIERIHELFSEGSLVSGFDEVGEWLQDVQTSSGLAISLNEAALCLLDYRRTGQFMRGLYRAIKVAQTSFPKETIEILYAGCGPYAPFVTMLAPLFSLDEIRFTLIEINPESLRAARALLRELELHQYVRKVYCKDATTFQVPEANRFHILFTETMDAALENEPMVPILLNLVPQLRKDISVVPKNVLIEAAFYKKGDLKKGLNGLWDVDNDDEKSSIGTLIELASFVSDAIRKQKKPGTNIPLLKVDTPHLEKWDYLTLSTTVEIGDDLFLYKNESDITDLRVREMDDLPEGKGLQFYYCLEKKPEIKFGVV